MSSEQSPVGVLEGLAKLAEYLEEDTRRESFASDSDAALQDAGIPPGVIPPQTLEVLRRCSEAELAAISKVGKGLEADGLYVDVPGDFGRVFFF